MPKGKKNFATVVTEKQDTNVTGAVFAGIEKSVVARSGAQVTATEEEQMIRREELRTQGRKGCKEKRYSITLTPKNAHFVTVMRMARGMTISQFINAALAGYRNTIADFAELERILERQQEAAILAGEYFEKTLVEHRAAEEGATQDGGAAIQSTAQPTKTSKPGKPE